MNFTCHGCKRLFSLEKKLKVHKNSFAGTITTALQRFSASLTDSPHELLRALSPNLRHLLRALESDFTGSSEPSLLRATLSELLQALEHNPIPCPGPRCKKSFESEKNLRRHYRIHVYTNYDCPHCTKPLRNVSHVHTHPASCPGRNGAQLTKEEMDTRQRFFDHSNNKLDEERRLVRPSLKRTREENEEGGGNDDERGGINDTSEERGVSKGKRGGSDDMCGESGGSDEECEGSFPTLPHSDNLRPEQMSPSSDETARQNTVSHEVQCSSTYENVTAAQQESFSFGKNSLFDNGTSGGPPGGPTVIISRNEATSSYNIDNISHPCSWSDTEVTARAPSTTYGTHTEGLEPQSNRWAPGAVETPAPTNYSLVENDVRYAQAPALYSHPVDQFNLGNLFGTQHNDEITTAHPLTLEYLGYGTQHHPP